MEITSEYMMVLIILELHYFLGAATSGAAKLLGAGNRIGLVQPGYEATLLIVEGNPVEDITNTQRVWSVLFKGERVRRESLLNKDKDE